MDGRRHSIDVPISRTLTALRRVRSLRDPSTNSMSKLSSLVDNLNWETNSNNGITLGFKNGSCGSTNDNNFSSMLFREEERHVSDHELYYGSRCHDSRLVSRETLGGMVEGADVYPLDLEIVCDNKVLSERCCKDYGNKGLEFTYATPSSDCVEGGGSCNEPDETSMQAEKRRRGGSKCKIWQPKLDGSSRVMAGDVSSHAGSPCLSVSEAPKGWPSRGMSLYRNEDVGFMESCQQGCGISSCWSRTTKFRESNVFTDVEEQPLLLENTGQDWKHNSEGVSQYIESPRSICQKFMPKSFNELVGQNTVAASLLTAICNRQIASLYLFHGPRGTGKTSASRLFAAAVNCLSPEISRPCGLCQECVLFFSGRSRDVKEVDPVRINRTSRCRSLIKNVQVPPAFSQYKVYIIDECHVLHRETWATILNSLEELPRHVVFIVVTPNLDKLPRAAVSRSQRYHFQKVKEVDIVDKLEKICIQECLNFDQDALNLIATKSNGSLRDAEMMLDQLSLLGKKITMSLVYEVNGVVSDDELLDLLYLALSSDASNTVKRARELMRSRIDPLQLISQLANLIMDILAGKCPDGASEVRRKLFGADNSEADLQQLSHALKVLSQTEKQLRMSKNQTTWLTVALLQLGSTGSLHDVTDARLSMKSLNPQDGDFRSTSSTCESLKHPVACTCEDVASGKMGMQKDDKETLESVWIKATGICTSSSLKKFLQKRGKLVSIRLAQGIAVVKLEFDHPDYVSKAEKSWKEIAGALQHIVGYNVELRINLAHNASDKHEKFKKPYFSLFSCSHRVNLKSQFSTDCGSNASENSDVTSTIITRDRYVETCSSDCGSQTSRTCCHGKGLFKTIRSNDGNALSIGVGTRNGLLPDSKVIDNKSQAHPLSKGLNEGFLHSIAFKPESKHGPREWSKFHCWKTATFPFRKALQLRHPSHSERLVDYTLHCAAAN